MEGRFGVRIGDEVFEAGPGAYVYKPRAVPHAFWNATDEPARLIELIWPAGFERFFDELATAYDDGKGVPAPDRVDELAERMDKVMELTNGSFRPDVHDILASDDHVAALVTVHAERDGTPVDWTSVDLFHLRDGKLSEHWVHEVDQEAVNRFWSSGPIVRTIDRRPVRVRAST